MSPASHAMSLLRRTYVGLLHRMRLHQYRLEHGLNPGGPPALEELEPKLMLSGHLALDEPDLEPRVVTNSALTFAGPLAVRAEDDLHVDETVHALLTVTHGQLQAVLPGGQPAASAQIEIIGTLAQVNDSLATLAYVPAADYAGDDALAFVLSDDQSGYDAGTLAITVDPSKDVPTIDVPTSTYMVADSELYFYLLGSGLTAGDPDEAGALYDATLVMNHGGVQASGSGGATISGDGDVELYISGTLEQVNAAFQSLVFSPTAGFVGTAGFDLVLQAWYPGDMTSLVTTDAAVPVTVLESVTPHTITTPPALIATADAPLYFTPAHATEIRFADPQSTVANYNATSVVPEHGAIYFGSDAGTASISGTPWEMSVDGTLDELNTAFDAMYFLPEAGYTGPATVQIYSMKYFQACYDGWQAVYASIDLTVFDPVLTVPAVVAGPADGAISVDDGSTVVALADGLDAAASPTYTVVLDPERGTLTTDAVAGVTVTGPTGGDDALTLSGPRDAVNDALASLHFVPAAAGAGTIAVTAAWPDAGSDEPVHSRSKLIQVLVDSPASTQPRFETDHVDLVAYRSGGQDLTFALPLTDPAGDYTYSAWLNGVAMDLSAAPLTVHPSTGVFTWFYQHPGSPSLSTAPPGRHIVRIEASDGTNAASIDLSVLITDATPAPVFEIDPVGDRYIGQSYVQSFRVLDPAAPQSMGSFYLAAGLGDVVLTEAVLVDAEAGDLDVTDRFALVDSDVDTGEISLLFLGADGSAWNPDLDDAGVFAPQLLGRDLAGKTLRIRLAATSWVGGSSTYAYSFRVDLDPAHTPPAIVSPACDTIAPVSWQGPPTYVPWAYQVQANLSAPIQTYELLPVGGGDLPAGLVISELHGLMAWRGDWIAEAAPAGGAETFAFIIRVTDALGGVAEQTFSLTVKAANDNHSVRGIVYDDRNGNGIRDGISSTGLRPLLVYVMDVSTSMESPYDGSTRREKQINYITHVNNALIDAGFGDVVDVALVRFSEHGHVMDLDGNVPVGADYDENGLYDVQEAVDGLEQIPNETYSYFTTSLNDTTMLIDGLTGGGDGAVERDVVMVFLSDGRANGADDPEGIGPALQAIDATVEGRDDGIADNGTPSLAVRAYQVTGDWSPTMQVFGFPEDDIDPPPGVDSRFVVTADEADLLADLNTVFINNWGIDLTSSSEPGLPDQTVYIDADGNGRLDAGEWATTTGPYGHYAFHGLGEGTYTVRVDTVETVDRGNVVPWVQTSPSQFAPHIIEIDADGISVDGAPPVAEDEVTDVDFGFRTGTATDAGAVAGTVFRDVNRNGVMDFEMLPVEVPHIIFMMDVSASVVVNGLLDDEAAALTALNQYLIDQGLGTSTAVSLVRYSSGPLPPDWSAPPSYVDVAVPNPEGPHGHDNLGWQSILPDELPELEALTPLADYDADGILDLEERALNTDCFLYTPYIPALEGAAKLLEHYDVGPGEGMVIFLSDGHPTDGFETGAINVAGITQAVRRVLALGAEIRAFGIGDNSLLGPLQILDPTARVVEPTTACPTTWTPTGFPTNRSRSPTGRAGTSCPTCRRATMSSAWTCPIIPTGR